MENFIQKNLPHKRTNYSNVLEGAAPLIHKAAPLIIKGTGHTPE
jgi:hypothetical protein